MNDHQGMGQRIAWRSLTFQMLAIVVFPLILLLLVIAFGSTVLHESAMRDLVGDRDERAARMAATAIEDHVQRRANEIRALAGQVSESAATREDSAWAKEILENAGYLNADFDAGLAIFAIEGQELAARGDPKIWREQMDRVSTGLKALEDNPQSGVYISENFDPSGQSPPLMVVMALAANGQHVVAGAFFTRPLGDRVFANVFLAEQEASVAVVAPDGRVLYRKGFDAAGEEVSQHVGVAEALNGETGTTYIKVQGSEHVVAYSPVAPFGWALLIEEPWEQVTSPILQNTHTAPLVLVPVVLLSLLALFFGIRQIVQPLQALAVQSGKLGWGDYQAIEQPVGGVSEIRQLQHELIHMAHKLRAAQQSLHSYIGAITSGQEEERRRLARELHDDTIQSLIALKQRVQLVEMDWEDHPVSKSLSELENFAEQVIENLRRMVSALRPIYLEDLGLVTAVNMLVTDTGKTFQLPVTLTRQGKERRLEAPVELALYRIVQESLSNITRHSGASNASIKMAFLADKIQIEIEDNGKGFAVPRSPAEFAPSGHFGLLGMFERADLIGADLKVDSKPGIGTRLVITAPYTLQEAREQDAVGGLLADPSG